MPKKSHGSSYPSQAMPTAPPASSTNSDAFQPRAPPPSYEESQKNSNFYYLQQQQPQLQPQYPPPTYGVATAGMGYMQTPPIGYQGAYGPYNSPQYRSQPGGSPNVQTYTTVTTTQIKTTNPQVLEFDSGARFKGKGAGSLTVPPPPPGYAPTPAQIAAMQGQPVVLQKKKKSFF